MKISRSGLARSLGIGLVYLFWGLLGSSRALAAAQSPSFDFHALQLLIEEGESGTVEELLAALPVSYRSHYVLVFSSRSLQQASMRDPRAIIYGGDAHLIVSFNGDPAQRGYDALETMEFDPGTARFRLREIRPAESAAGASRLQVSEPDPARCLLCHGTPPRPLWDGSPFWPSVYGEHYRANLSAKERTGLLTFLAQQPTHARYRTLPKAARFAYRGTFAPQSKGEYDSPDEEPPNAELSRLLGQMNVQMIMRGLREGPHYASYRYALLAAVEGRCGGPVDLLPDSKAAPVDAGFRAFTLDTDEADRRRDESKRRRSLKPSAAGISPVSLPASGDLTAFRFLAEYGLGAATQQWNMSFENSRSDFRVSPEDSEALAGILRGELKQDDMRLRDLAAMRDYSSDDRYCAYLRERSRASIAALADIH